MRSPPKATGQAPLERRRVCAHPTGWYDRLERAWESESLERAIGTALVLGFIASLTAIELNRQDLLPRPISLRLPTSHFAAIGPVFAALLAAEVIGLVFALGRSVANSVGKQFELLSLILLRKAFLEFAKFGEPVQWTRIAPSVPVIMATWRAPWSSSFSSACSTGCSATTTGSLMAIANRRGLCAPRSRSSSCCSLRSLASPVRKRCASRLEPRRTRYSRSSIPF